MRGKGGKVEKEGRVGKEERSEGKKEEGVGKKQRRK